MCTYYQGIQQGAAVMEREMTECIHDDRNVIAHYDLDGEPHHKVFDFKRLKPGSDARVARCREYERIVEALKGQGCVVKIWPIEYWSKYRKAFYNGYFRGEKK